MVKDPKMLFLGTQNILPSHNGAMFTLATVI